MAGETKRLCVKAVFFDVFNTLARFWPPREQLQAQACEEFGIRVDPAGIDRGYAAADALMALQNSTVPLRAQASEERRTFFARYEQRILQGAGVEVDLELAGRIWQRVRQIQYRLVLFDDVLPSLSRLRERGFRLGVISNINQEGTRLVQGLGLDDVVHFAVTPFEVLVEKPHPAMFQAALDRAGVAAREAAHVGDQLTSDVEGARAVGIHPVLMDRYGASEQPAGCPLVRGMVELEAVLEC